MGLFVMFFDPGYAIPDFSIYTRIEFEWSSGFHLHPNYLYLFESHTGLGIGNGNGTGYGFLGYRHFKFEGGLSLHSGRNGGLQDFYEGCFQIGAHAMNEPYDLEGYIGTFGVCSRFGDDV